MNKKETAQLTEVKTLIGNLTASVHEKLAALDKKVEGLDYIIRGNGTPGLAARVTILETGSKDTKEEKKEWNKAKVALLSGLVLSLVANFLQWLRS